MPQDIQLVRHTLSTAGLRLREQDVEALLRWTAERVRTLALRGIGQYGQLLAEDSAAGRRERELLTVQFSTGESYFFRDQGQFDLLAATILPELIERRAQERKLRLWSAGCAAGEEMTMEDAKETMAAYLELNKGKRLPLFAIARINMRLPPVSV